MSGQNGRAWALCNRGFATSLAVWGPFSESTSAWVCPRRKGASQVCYEGEPLTTDMVGLQWAPAGGSPGVVRTLFRLEGDPPGCLLLLGGSREVPCMVAFLHWVGTEASALLFLQLGTKPSTCLLPSSRVSWGGLMCHPRAGNCAQWAGVSWRMGLPILLEPEVHIAALIPQCLYPTDHLVKIPCL